MKIKPGIYEGMPFDKYKAIDAVNSSSLAALDRSLFHWWYLRQHPQPSTRSLEFGSAYHALILEPDEFAKTYERNPYGNWRTKEAREFRDLLEEQGRIAISDNPNSSSPWEGGDWHSLQQMQVNLNDHVWATELLNGRREVTIVWEDPDFGILCKGRIDCVNDDKNFLVDLKSTRDASPNEFRLSVFKWRYHAQGAFYLDGWEDLNGGLQANGFIFVASEKVPPFETACYSLAPDFVKQGREWYKERLARLQEPLDRDEFESYHQGVMQLKPVYSGRASL